MMNRNSLIFIGKCDENLLSFEEKVLINLELCINKNPPTEMIKNLEMPDVILYKNAKYKAYTIIGDVKPTLLMKSLIVETKIIIFIIDLNNTETSEFLLDGWGQIFSKINLNDLISQKRFLVGINSSKNIDRDNHKILDIIKKFECSLYFEIGASEIPKRKINEIEINNYENLITQIHNIGDNFINEEEAENDKNENENNQNEENESDEIIINEKPITITSKDSIVFQIYEMNEFAEIFKSPKVKNDVFIPTFVPYKSKEYNILRICDDAFSGSKIKSLSFSESSKVQRIGNNAFEQSTLCTLHIPASLEKLDKYWCKGANNLSQIEVNKGNQYFSIQEGFLIYQKQIEEGNILLKELVFSPRDGIIDFTVPEDITHICEYSFSKRSDLALLTSDTLSLKSINSFSFFNCQNLTTVVLKHCTELVLGDCCFANSPKLSCIDIENANLKICKSCFINCPLLSLVLFKNIKSISFESNSFEGCSNIGDFSNNNNELYFIIEKDCLINSNLFNFLKQNISLSFLNIEIQGDIKITSDTFVRCEWLRKIKINSSSKIKLCKSCFETVKNLRFIQMKSKSLEFDSKSFYNCSSLTYLNIETVDSITLSSHIFSECDKLNNLAIISGSIIIINNEFMSGSKTLSVVSLSGSKIFIGDYCFRNCSSLKTFSIINSGDIQIGKKQFENCLGLNEIVIGCNENLINENIPKIDFGSYCFSGAKNLKMITIFSGDVSINNQCFNSCSLLTDIIFIEMSNVFIANNQFSTCKSLSTINIQSKSKVEFGIASFLDLYNLRSVSISSPNILIRNGCFKNCKSLSIFQLQNTQNISIQSDVFCNCCQITKIDFKAKMISIGDNCFAYTNIQTLSLQGEIIKIGKNCFKKCEMLERVSFTSQKIQIENNAFELCKKMQKLSINAASTLEIKSHCFAFCECLNSIDFNCQVLTLDSYNFFGCSSIKSFKLHDLNVVLIGENVFEGCNQLETFDVAAQTLFQTWNSCFEDIKNLKSVVISSQKVIIGSYCFKKCLSLSSFTVNSCNEIELQKEAFCGCNSLMFIDVTAKMQFLADDNCFSNAKNLQNVRIDSNHILFGNKCFEKCVLLQFIKCNAESIIEHINNSFSGVSKNFHFDPIHNTPIKVYNTSFGNKVSIKMQYMNKY